MGEKCSSVVEGWGDLRQSLAAGGLDMNPIDSVTRRLWARMQPHNMVMGHNAFPNEMLSQLRARSTHNKHETTTNDEKNNDSGFQGAVKRKSNNNNNNNNNKNNKNNNNSTIGSDN